MIKSVIDPLYGYTFRTSTLNFKQYTILEVTEHPH